MVEHLRKNSTSKERPVFVSFFFLLDNNETPWELIAVRTLRYSISLNTASNVNCVLVLNNTVKSYQSSKGQCHVGWMVGTAQTLSCHSFIIIGFHGFLDSLTFARLVSIFIIRCQLGFHWWRKSGRLGLIWCLIGKTTVNGHVVPYLSPSPVRKYSTCRETHLKIDDLQCRSTFGCRETQYLNIHKGWGESKDDRLDY